MSTEATGDGKPDTADVNSADTAAERPEPTTTALEEPAAQVPRQAAPDEAPDDAAVADEAVGEAAGPDEATGAVEAPDDGDALGNGETPEPEAAVGAAENDEASVSGEGGERGVPGDQGEPGEAREAREADTPGETDGPGETDDPGQPDVSYEEYETYETYESDEADEAEDAEEADEADAPRRAKRWPRILLALGFVVLAVAIVGGAIAIVGSLTHGFKKPVKVTYKASAVFSLKTGDCFDPQGQQSYTLISCESPHQAEVFATFALTGANWPGNAAVQAEASNGCATRLTGYVNPQLAISLSSTYVYPDSVAWQAGTRTVICEVRAATGQLTGSVRGASASAG